ncbi:LptF/LptG family permease [bacterium]|nr:LptF/LptG family permease [bacterium]
MRILTRYILREFIAPFFSSLCVFTFILFMGNMFRLANMLVNEQISILGLSKLVVYLLPFLLTYTLPMAVLVAILTSIGRLSSDNEIIAMKANGIDPYRIITPPILAIGIILCLISWPLNNTIAPKANFSSKKLFKEIGILNSSALLKEKTPMKIFKGYTFYADKIRNKILYNVVIHQSKPDSSVRTITAKQGRFISDPKNESMILKLENGSVEEFNPKNPNEYFKCSFKIYPIDFGSLVYGTIKLKKSAIEMTSNDLKNKIMNTKTNANKLSVELYRKASLSFTFIPFILIGIPLSIRYRRSSKFAAIGIGIPVIFLHYLLMMLGSIIGQKGYIPPVVAMWLPNIIIATIGIYLIYKTSYSHR